MFDPPQGFKAIDRELLPCNLLGENYDLLRFKVESATGHLPRKTRMEGAAKLEIFFEDLAIYEDMPSGERLGNLCKAVKYIVGRFEEEFAASRESAVTPNRSDSSVV